MSSSPASNNPLPLTSSPASNNPLPLPRFRNPSVLRSVSARSPNNVSSGTSSLGEPMFRSVIEPSLTITTRPSPPLPINVLPVNPLSRMPLPLVSSVGSSTPLRFWSSFMTPVIRPPSLAYIRMPVPRLSLMSLFAKLSRLIVPPSAVTDTPVFGSKLLLKVFPLTSALITPSVSVNNNRPVPLPTATLSVMPNTRPGSVGSDGSPGMLIALITARSRAVIEKATPASNTPLLLVSSPGSNTPSASKSSPR